MIVRQDEILVHKNGETIMHVQLRVGIPLLTAHEKSQGVKTRNFMAIRNGDAANPALALTGQDALTFSQAVVDNLQYGDKIELAMYNVDQAGNVSTTALDGSTVLVDTTPPDAPLGSFTMNLAEVADPGDDDEAASPPAASPPADTGDASSPPSG